MSRFLLFDDVSSVKNVTFSKNCGTIVGVFPLFLSKIHQFFQLLFSIFVNNFFKVFQLKKYNTKYEFLGVGRGGGNSNIWGEGNYYPIIPKFKRSHFTTDLRLQIKNSLFFLGGNNNLEENQLCSIRGCEFHK